MNRTVPLIFLTLALCSLARAQLRISVSTDKPGYSYGESITLVGTVTNLADTAVTVRQPWQGPVTEVFFDHAHLSWLLLPTELPYEYLPHQSYRSTFKIDGDRMGLPNQEGPHFLVCSFYWEFNGNLFYGRDSVMISQSPFYGGQLLVEYSVHTPPSQIQSLIDSMHATVISSNTYSETVIARWQTSGFILDSLVAKYTGDGRLTGIAADRSISPPTTVAQTNHKPVLISRKPVSGPNVVPTNPLTFSISASDPDGDSLTYTWKVNTLVKKVGRDTSWIFYPSDLQRYTTYVVCVFADPEGLNDSTRWHIGPDLFVDPSLNPDEFYLSQNYPNPFNPSTTIRYHLPKAAKVVLKIFNILGAPVSVLVEKNQAAGDYEFVWTANVPSGVYIYRLETSQYWESRKMLLVK